MGGKHGATAFSKKGGRSMIHYRERPKCRKALLQLCKDYDCTLHELLDHPLFHLKKDLRAQCKKMIQEQEIQKRLDSLEYIKCEDSSIPIMRCEVHGSSWRFFCPYCGRYHYHTPHEGFRFSHCDDKFSSPQKDGYYLKLGGPK